MSSDIAIQARDLGRLYYLYDRPSDRLKQMFLWGRRQLYREFWALRGVSFDVKRGEAFGVIGRNGSGKSTLLQIIAGTLTASEGSATVRGRTTALLELGSGFNPEFSGRENVYLNGTILGLSKREIDERLDEILDFAAIGDFIDQPIKTYSSGMVVRLAFAVQIGVEPDVLVIDEALGVGDIFFQQKCFELLRKRRKQGLTLLFVSHDLETVKRFCDRALVLEDGTPTFLGNASDAAIRYHRPSGTDRKNLAAVPRCIEGAKHAGSQHAYSAIIEKTILSPKTLAPGTSILEIVAARVSDSSGESSAGCTMNDRLVFEMIARSNEHISRPNFGVEIFDRFGTLVYSTGMAQLGHFPSELSPGDEVLVGFTIEMSVQPGQYTFSLEAAELQNHGNPNEGISHHRIDGLGPINISFDTTKLMPFYGLARLPTEASLSLHAAQPANQTR